LIISPDALPYRMFEIISVLKGGGYLYCRTIPRHPKANSKGLYPLHRVLAENEMGRLLEGDEIVHHKDGDKSNNALANLEVMARSAHSKHHGLERGFDLIAFVCLCGKKVSLKPHIHRLRIARNKSGRLYCSRSCGTKFT
jgi:hypothetical protein